MRQHLNHRILLSFALGFVLHALFWQYDQLIQITKVVDQAEQLDRPRETMAKKDDNNTEANNGETAAILPTDMCSALNLSTSSSSSIWAKHVNRIILATRHLTDPTDQFIYHDFTARLLNYMKPQRLQTSVKTLPSRYWDQVGKIMTLAWERYQFVKHGIKPPLSGGEEGEGINKEPRKLNVLVMGGSVTMGVVCMTNPVQVTRIARRLCAWPSRFGQFINELFGDVLDVHVTTLGGTNTESAIRIWEYSLFPSDMPHPDIVIHAYSTNDMHVLSENEAEKRGITLEEMIFQINQLFVRSVLKPPKDCSDRPTPLLLYYDDYVGNEQREIVKTKSFANAAHSLATYYGFSLVSYADAVRHLVYGDTNEDWFSPNMWPDRQVHPGMGMHISSAWVVAFNMLNMATSYCSGLFDKNKVKDGANTHEYLPKNGLPELKDDKKLAGEPQFFPQGLPPELNSNTTLDNISTAWQSTQSSYFDTSNCKESDHSMQKPCIFSWVGGLERSFEKPEHLEERMKTVLSTNDGWKASTDNDKLGYQATKSNAVFEIKLILENIPVQTLNFMVMTSYGEKWEGSKIQVDAFVDKSGNDVSENPTRSTEIAGFHDRQTSETYNHKLDLNEERALPNDTLRVRITLVGGTTFKFMGMALCDH